METKQVKEQKISLQALRQLRDRPCKTKAELNNWLKIFLDIHLPDQTLDPDSNCNPLEMIWKVYNNMIYWKTIPDEERENKFLFYATRGGFKTLGSAILEVLALLHDKRGTAHIAAGENHVKHCYNNYFQPFIKRPLIWEMIGSSTIEKTTLKDTEHAFVEIMPCTKKRVQGPHQPFVVKDEIDVVEDLSAYSDIDGIAVNTRDMKPPITMGISVRKTAFGLVQKEIDEAPKKGIGVYHWNLIDITKRCPDSRSGKKEAKFYVKKNTLEAITPEQFEKIPFGQRDAYELHKGRENCLKNCKIFAACRGLLKKQESESPWLKEIDYTEEKLTESTDEQMIIAQFLCRKPPSTGLIYPTFTEDQNRKTYNQMYEIFMGRKPEGIVSKEDLVNLFHAHSIPCYMGVDFGFDPDPNVALAIFIDKKKNIYVVDEYVSLKENEPELALWLHKNWLQLYKPILVYPDTARPSGRRALEDMGFLCAGPKRLGKQTQKKGANQNVIKDVLPGISTVRQYIKIPGQAGTRLFVAPCCTQLLYEMPRYHNIVGSNGDVLQDRPDPNNSDHACDALRYCIHSVLSTEESRLLLENAAPKYNDPGMIDGKMSRAPSPVEAAGIFGFTVMDNSYVLEDMNPNGTEKTEEQKLKEMAKEESEDGFDDIKEKSGAGFSFSF